MSPIFDTKCLKCGTVYEDVLYTKGLEIHNCPKCGVKLEKLPPRVGVKFKGEGWTGRLDKLNKENEAMDDH